MDTTEADKDSVARQVCTAGTADLPVAEEAAVTAELLGITEVVRLWDVGVAGIQRLLRNRETVNDCDVVIVAAGMEGALPSVVAVSRHNITAAWAAFSPSGLHSSQHSGDFVVARGWLTRRSWRCQPRWGTARRCRV